MRPEGRTPQSHIIGPYHGNTLLNVEYTRCRRQERLDVRIVEQPISALTLRRPHQCHAQRGLADTGREIAIAHRPRLPPADGPRPRPTADSLDLPVHSVSRSRRCRRRDRARGPPACSVATLRPGLAHLYG